MLSIFDAGEKYPITGYDNFYIDHVDGGEDTLNFSVKTDAEIYRHIAEENRVEFRDCFYKVKSIDAPSTYANVSCTVDLGFLKQNFHKVYDSGSLTLFALLQTFLPAGWTIKGCNPGIHRTIHMENATDYDIAKQAMSTYSVAYEWHTKTKPESVPAGDNSQYETLVILDPNDTTPSGEYLTDQLNLRKIAFKGKSTDFCTRLYPYGKDGLTIASVNDGKEYIENHQYSNDVICGYWKDDRHTVPENLKADAEERLATLSVPSRSYDCDVIDLAKLDPKYSDFKFSMYKVVTLIDRLRHIRINHQIMEYKEYPDEPQRNELTLSRVLKGVKVQLSQAIAAVQGNVNSVEETVNQHRDVQSQFSNLMANALGYYHTEQQDEQGRTTEYIHNKPFLSKSSTIWKFSIDGFSVSLDGGMTWKSGITADGNIVSKTLSAVGIVADWIRCGGSGANGKFTVKDATDNDMLVFDNRGITMQNGAKLIGGNGVLSEFVSVSEGTYPCGFSKIGWFQYNRFQKSYLFHYVYVPDGITITKATMYVDIMSTYYQYTEGDPSGIAEGAYTASNITATAETDFSELYMGMSYADSEAEMHPSSSGTSISEFGTWNPRGSKNIQSKQADVTRYMKSGGRTLFCVSGGADTYGDYSHITDAGYAKITIVVEGYKS